MDIAADADANAISAKGWSKEEASAKQSLPVSIKKSSAEESPADIAEESSESDYDHGPNSSDHLMPFPPGDDGDRTPFDLWRYAGKGASSFTSPTLPMSWDEWLEFNQQQKPELMKDVQTYMAKRYDFSEKKIAGKFMSGGRKPVMAGPVARLPKGIDGYEAFSNLTADTIRQRDLFPYKPLAHPLQTTAHMVFPDSWIQVHPEHKRIDVDHDFPDAYLPEFPPPLFLSTHKGLGDVSEGREITFENYWDIFNGLLTPEQMEGLKELLRPTPTTWFNQTHHRVTREPSTGVACFSCHVNGHTNGAFELAPDARPNQARLRVDTPSMRGNYNMMQLSSKRSIRSMDHFAERLFHGKAKCDQCHYGPAFTDDYLHDLQVERFYVGRPEGPIKTFALRGIKDTPPYLHDGRCPTLNDAVEFFNIILDLKLNTQEKDDLVAFLLCL
ncbi:MAG: cytochrome C [Gammaproteobacteria bacterium]